MNFMAIDNQLFSICEDQGFIELIAHLQPKYIIPSRRFFSDKMLPQAYKTLQALVFENISMAQYLSFTTDIWTNSYTNDSFISLSCHYIGNDFNKVDCVLNCKHFPESHTGINIAAIFETMLTEWQIPESKIHLVIRDAAANMKLGVELSNIDSISCFLHGLQLVLKDAVFSQKTVAEIIKRSKSICTHFNHSSLSTVQLKRIQKEIDPKLPENRILLPIQDVATRWNSTFLMLERIEKLKRPLQLFIADHPNIPVLTSSDWKYIENILYLLQPFFMITESISKTKSLISTVIPHVRALNGYLSSIAEEDLGVKKLKNGLRNALKDRFLNAIKSNYNVFESRIFVVSTSLDPRYKNTLFPENTKKNLRTWLFSEVKKIVIADSKDSNDSGSSSDHSSPERKKAKTNAKQTESNISSIIRSRIAENFLKFYKHEEIDTTWELKAKIIRR